VIRAVLDPGVLVSSLVSRRGAPAALVRAWQDGLLEVVTCRHLIDELRRALAYPKLRSIVPPSVAEIFVRMLEEGSTQRPDPTEIPAVCADPNDDYLFALTRDAGGILVSGDRRVLEVTGTIVRVLRPDAVAELLRGAPNG
jgi:putative PIN family toxin of toxin-antitoxin system